MPEGPHKIDNTMNEQCFLYKVPNDYSRLSHKCHLEISAIYKNNDNFTHLTVGLLAGGRGSRGLRRTMPEGSCSICEVTPLTLSFPSSFMLVIKVLALPD